MTKNFIFSMGASRYIFVILILKLDYISSLNVSTIASSESLVEIFRNISMEMTRYSKLTEKMQQNISTLQAEIKSQRLLIQHLQDNSVLFRRVQNWKPRRKAQHVAFTAQNTNDLMNLGVGETLKFDNVVTNVGGRYDASTGVFTADISGMYVFTFVVRVRRNSMCWIDLVKDGKRVVIGWAKGVSDEYGHENGGNFVVVHLSVGNSVWLKNKPEAHFSCSIDDLSSFAGFLYFQD